MNIVSKYFFAYSFSWVEGVATYIAVWVAMFGGALCIRRGAHVEVDVIDVVLPKKILRVLYSIISLGSGLFMLTFAYNGYILVSRIKATGQVSPTMEFFPMYWLYVCIPLGSILMAVQFFKIFWNNFKGVNISKISGKEE